MFDWDLYDWDSAIRYSFNEKTFKKLRPRIKSYDYLKHFSSDDYRESLIDSISKQIYVDRLRSIDFVK